MKTLALARPTQRFPVKPPPPLVKGVEKGQGMVELGISLIILLVLLAGIVDLSFTILTKMAMQDAAEEGVVYAMAFPNNCTQIKYRVLANISNVSSITVSNINDHIKIYYDINKDGVISETSAEECTTSGSFKSELFEVKISTNVPVSMPFLGAAIGSTREITVKSKGVVIGKP